MLTTFYPPYHFGGDAVSVHRLAEALASRGHEVDVVYSRDAFFALGGRAGAPAPRDHAKVRRIEVRTRWPRLAAIMAHQLGGPGLYSKRLRALLEEGRYDVIHYHNVSLLGGPDLLELGSAVKLYTPHDYWLVCPTSALVYFDREPCETPRCTACVLAHRKPPQLWRYLDQPPRALAHLDMLLPPSQFALERHRRAGITTPMRVLPCLVGSVEAAPSTTALDRVHRPFFLFAGRLERLKGVQDLLTIFAEYRAADLVIVGAGSYAAQLREQARGLAHVHFVDAVPPEELVPLYRQALAVLVPSVCYETFCLTAAESLSVGTPVIARDHGALREMIMTSEGGLCFSTQAECLAAMERVRENAELREGLGERGQRYAQRNWTTDHFIEGYVALVENLLSRRSQE